MLQLVVEALDANPGDKKEYWVNARTDTEGEYTSPLTQDNLNTGILITLNKSAFYLKCYILVYLVYLGSLFGPGEP